MLTAINYFGVKPGAVVQNIFTAGKLLALAGLILLGLTSPTAQFAPSQPATGGPEGSLVHAFGAALAPVLFSDGGGKAPRGLLGRSRILSEICRAALSWGSRWRSPSTF